MMGHEYEVLLVGCCFTQWRCKCTSYMEKAQTAVSVRQEWWTKITKLSFLFTSPVRNRV